MAVAVEWFDTAEGREKIRQAIRNHEKHSWVIEGLKRGAKLANEVHTENIINTHTMDEDIDVNDDIKTGYNLGYRLAATAEGRKKAVELIKGKEDLPISKAIEAGVKQGMTDELSEGLEAIMGRKKDRGMRH